MVTRIGQANYPAAMRRDSVFVRGLVAASVARGTPMSGRQLESWSQAALLPANVEAIPRDRLLDHLTEVAKLYRPGPGAADRVALILAARGFGCERLRDAVARGLGASTPKEIEGAARAAADQLPDPESDEGSWEIERQARVLLGASGGQEIPPAIRGLLHLVEAAIKQEARQRPIIDPVTEQPDSPATTVFDAVTLVLGSGFSNASLDDDVTNLLGNALFGEQRELSDRGRDLIATITPEIASAPLGTLASISDTTADDLVRGAQYMLQILRHTPAIAKDLSPEHRQVLEWIAGLLGFVGIAIGPLLEPIREQQERLWCSSYHNSADASRSPVA